MKRNTLVVLILLGLSSILIGLGVEFESSEKNIIENEPYGYLAYNTEQYRYLSDIDYIKEQSSVGWGAITLDQNLDTSVNNGLISLIVDGKKKSFFKGISAHATSTLVYDLSGYDYDYFSTYYGVDAGRGANGNGVKFAIYTSKDGESWDLHTLVSPPVKKGDSEAEIIKINIKGIKYLKLYANSNGSNTADHAVYADAKLFKEGYVEDTSTVDFIKTVEDYDKIIKGQNLSNQLSTNELTILQREFVNSVGYDILQSFVKYSDDNKEAISWLMNDVENLKLYIMGGKPDGSYINSIKVLSELYKEYEPDFENKEVTKYGTVLGDLYKKMAITLSLTHSTRVALWMQPSAKENQSDALKRYAIYKYLHKNEKLKASDTLDFTPWFEALNVEEMRFIMNNAIDDEEILWLNAYVKTKIIEEPNRAWLTPHPHMAYVWPNYSNPVYYDENNKDYFNELFAVKDEKISENKIGLFDLKYTIPGGKNNPTYDISITRSTTDNKLYKVWMNFRNKFGTGAVCGGISKSGSNIRATHGIPATVIGQPGHAALLFYSKDANGKGYWGIDNDVSGWTLSEKGERMLLGWGNASYTRGSYQVVYMVLAQEVLNDYETFEKSKEMTILGNSYKGDLVKQEEVYRKALEIQPLNIDAWYELIQVYNESEKKTEEDYYNLAEELSEKLKYFPLPMYQLSNLIKPKLTSIENSYRFALMQDRILKEASVVPNNTAENYYVYQPSITRLEANYLLGKADNSIAKFSFDGEDAGKIVLANRFDGNGIRWDYSLDGKKTWKEVSFTAEEEHKLQLSEKELDSITAENDIYVHIVGVNYDEKNLYKIDIKGQEAPTNIYNNDLENKVIGATDTMEWRMVNSKKSRAANTDGWTSFKEKDPDLTGDKTVEVRVGKTGVYLESKSVTLDYTKDVVDEKKKYVPISHLSIENVSTEATGQGRYAKNAIDGNYNTNWHSAWNGSDNDKYITIKVDTPIYLSALDYVPAGGGNGKILEGQILGSLDGKNYQEVGKVTWKNDETVKTITFDNPMKLQYVKIVGTKTSSAGGGSFMAARMFNLYEDATKRVIPTAEIKYSTTSVTDKEVVATLVNPSSEITIVNNNGSNTYTFKENGSFTFEFVDKEGNKGEATATVNWIKNGNNASGDKPNTGDNNTSGDKPSTGDNNTSGDKPSTGDNNASGDKPSAGDNNTSGDKPSIGDNNTSGDKPSAGDNNTSGDKPSAGDNNTSGDKPSTGDNNTPGDKPSIGDNTSNNIPDINHSFNNSNIGNSNNRNESVETPTIVEVPNTTSDQSIQNYIIGSLFLSLGFVIIHLNLKGISIRDKIKCLMTK